MPESKSRKAAEHKQHDAKQAELKDRRRDKRRAAPVQSRAWVPATFITVGLLGVAWLVVYYIAGYRIPFMDGLGGWNILIGMGLMAASFSIATLWK